MISQTLVKRSPLSLDDRLTIAQALTWDLQREVHPEEIEGIRLDHDILWVKLSSGSNPIHRETFKSILATQRQQQAQSELNQYIETQAQELAPEVEIDRTEEGVYRAWMGTQLIGTFYYNRKLGKWEAEPRYAALRRYKTREQAQKAVTEAYTQKFCYAA